MPKPFPSARAFFSVTGRVLSTLLLVLIVSGCALSGKRERTNEKIFTPDSDFLRTAETVCPEEEDVIGRAVAAHILGIYPPIANATLSEYVNEVGLSVASHSPRPETFSGYHFLVLDTTEINALAAPGGYIFISKGLLQRLTNEDELAAVLAHEVTHVTERHGLQAIKPDHYANYSKVGSQIVSALDCSGLSSEIVAAFNGAVGDVVEALLVSGYSQRQEFAADKGAVTVLKNTGYSEESLRETLVILKEHMGTGGWFSTHPSPVERLSQLADSNKQSDAKAVKTRQTRFELVMKTIR